MSTPSDAARENARQADGKFGTYNLPKADTAAAARLLTVEEHDGLSEVEVRERVEDAIRKYEGGVSVGFPDMGTSEMAAAATEFAAHLPESRSSAVTKAITAFEESRDSGADPDTILAKSNTLRAELIDALATDIPNRAEMEALRSRAVEAKNAVTDAAIGRDMTRMGTPERDRAEAELEIARHALLDVQRLIIDGEKDRRDAAMMRVAQGRPTVHDMLEAQDRKDRAFFARRKAVNAADAARDAYGRARSTDRDFDAIRLRADQAIRDEFEAQERLDKFEADLAKANRAWQGHLGRDAHHG